MIIEQLKLWILVVLAITAFGTAGGGLAHSIDPFITARTHISHGAALSILLPPLMTFRLSSIPNRLAKIAKHMGEIVENLPPDQAAMKAIEGIVSRAQKILSLAVFHRYSRLPRTPPTGKKLRRTPGTSETAGGKLASFDAAG